VKILLALHQFPPLGSGGTEELARWTALALGARGHDARVVSAIPRRRGIGKAVPPAATRPDGVRVQFLDVPERPAGIVDRIALEYDDPDAGAAFGVLLDELRPDVVHFFHLHGMTAAAIRAASERNLPVAVTCTDFWLECPTAQLLLPDATSCPGPDDDRANCARHLLGNRLTADPSARWSATVASAVTWASRVPAVPSAARAWRSLQARSPRLREAANSAGAVLAPTDFMRSRLARFGVAAGRIRLVPYGTPVPDPARVRTSERGDTDGRLRIAFAGSLAPNKGAHLILEAMRSLPDLPAEAVLWGADADARYRRRLDRLADGDARIRFAGTFAAGEFAAILAWADVLVIPSLWFENAPLVLLEALGHRCPVIVADVPGLTEPMRVASDGWTFRRGDALDLAARIAWAAAHRSALCAVRATPYAMRTISQYVDDLLPIYDALRSDRERAA
jgi:glycosyltransferase involved in cell wall biosynthesis